MNVSTTKIQLRICIIFKINENKNYFNDKIIGARHLKVKTIHK